MSMSVSELQDLLDQATALKADGNKAFVIRPHTAATLKTAEEDYKRALGKLPNVPKHLPMPTLQDLAEKERIVEINDEEAEQIEKDQQAGPVRCNVDNEIRDAKKVLWANLGAVYVAQGRDREAVDACTRALHYDPKYQKALLRRASASEKLGTWSALTNAQRDYIALMGMLPASPLPGSADAQNLKQVEQGLKTLPAKIRAAKEKETNEATDKIGQSKISS
jgi:tetratricopeptide (TPR) repeat protein